MIRIVWVCPFPIGKINAKLKLSRTSISHAASWITNLLHEMKSRGDIEIHIITSSPYALDDQECLEDGVCYHIIRYGFPFSNRGFPRFLPLDVLTRYYPLRKKINSIIKSINPDIIHVHGTEYGYGYSAFEAGFPSLISIQGIISLMTRQTPSLFFKLHSYLEKNFISRSKNFGSRTKWANEFIYSINSNAIVFDLPEAMNPVYFSANRDHKTKDLLFVGAIERRKGIFELMRALPIIISRFPDVRLRIVGSGDRKTLSELKQLTKELQVDERIDWLGFQNADEIKKLHDKSCILLHPSYIDNSPNSVVEAMVSGLPVIASNVGGIPSIIQDGVTGLLCNARDENDLAKKAILLLANDDLRLKLSENARKNTLTRNHPTEVARRTVDIYKKIIESYKKENDEVKSR
ncbi:glycosyltransferase family 4 protein [bacterium]|nr:glycosyltransferase family 4 protein [bacterium]NUN46087.1 glycosyltransferase family 4 protein [bacterium]